MGCNSPQKPPRNWLQPGGISSSSFPFPEVLLHRQPVNTLPFRRCHGRSAGMKDASQVFACLFPSPAGWQCPAGATLWLPCHQLRASFVPLPLDMRPTGRDLYFCLSQEELCGFVNRCYSDQLCSHLGAPWDGCRAQFPPLTLSSFFLFPGSICFHSHKLANHIGWGHGRQ